MKITMLFDGRILTKKYLGVIIGKNNILIIKKAFIEEKKSLDKKKVIKMVICVASALVVLLSIVLLILYPFGGGNIGLKYKLSEDKKSYKVVG